MNGETPAIRPAVPSSALAAIAPISSGADHASKVCLVELARRLQLGGFELIDCQSITPTLRQFGARWVDFATYFRWFQRLRFKDCYLGE